MLSLCFYFAFKITRDVRNFENFGTEFWKGDIKRFGTNGSQEGLFLLPNYEIKDIWFPTKIKIKPEPFEIQFENNGERYHMEYKNGKIITAAIEGSI